MSEMANPSEKDSLNAIIEELKKIIRLSIEKKIKHLYFSMKNFGKIIFITMI